jgi:hypothetical protein
LVRRHLRLDRDLKAEFRRDTTIRYVSVMDYFCNAEGCLTYMGNDRQHGLVSWDYGHFTPMASSAFARDVLVPVIVNRTAAHAKSLCVDGQ